MSLEGRLNLIGKTNIERISGMCILRNESEYKLVYSIEFVVNAHTYDEDTSKENKVRWEARGAICDISINDCGYKTAENKLYGEKYSTYALDSEGNEFLKYDGTLLGWGGTDVKQYDSRDFSTSTKTIQLELMPGEENTVILDVIGNNATESTEGGDTRGGGDQRFYVESTEISWTIIGAHEVI